MKKNKTPSIKVNSKTKKIIVISGLAALLITGIILTVLLWPSKIVNVAFYKINEKEKTCLSTAIEEIAKAKKIQVNFIEYDSKKNLESQIPLAKKPEIIFTISGYALNSALDKAPSSAALPLALSQNMTTSMRGAAALTKNNKKIAGLPLLLSHFEVDVETMEFKESNVKSINSWTDIENFLQWLKDYRKKESPMIFAGGEGDFFLDLMGAIAESTDGSESYYSAVKIIEDEKKFNAARIAKKLCLEDDSPLYTSARLLARWYKKNLINQGVFSLKTNDVEAFASARLSGVLFMPLETHRSFQQKTISRYTSIYFPSHITANSRIFTGKTYYAVPMRKNKKASSIISELVSPKEQEALCRATGLAPVLAQCRTCDKQADDARYWIAATTAPLAGLSNEVYLTESQKKELIAEIAAIIKNWK